MKLTRNELFKWAKKQTQWTENELLNPHNPDITDSEIIDVLPWENFVSIIYAITEGRIEIEELQKMSDDISMMKLFEVIKKHTLSIEYCGRCECGGNKYNLVTDDGLTYPPVHEISIRNLKPELLEVAE